MDRNPISKPKSFLLRHWRLGLHLVLRTKKFGVNNHWWSSFPSTWGVPFPILIARIILVVPILRAYSSLKKRMGPSIGFVPKEWL